MSFHSLPIVARPALRATEARLEAIYNAAKLGLKTDALALAAGMLPVEYRRLKEFDPLVELAEMKGRADAEMKMAGHLHAAAEQGDAKAALAILQHQHGWVAKQQISVDVEQRISITAALEQAAQRVHDLIDVTPTPAVQPLNAVGASDAIPETSNGP